MAPCIRRRSTIPMLVGSILLALTMLGLFAPSAGAIMSFAQATGQPCSKCHVNPSGSPELNALGTAFAAIPTHETDPAGAFAQVTRNPISVAMVATLGDGTVAYMIMVRNSGIADISNVYVAGAIPSGATFDSAAATPPGATFFSSQGGSAAWLVGSVPAGGSAGPFVFTISRGTATDLSSVGFAHWLVPRDATATSPVAVPQ